MLRNCTSLYIICKVAQFILDLAFGNLLLHFIDSPMIESTSSFIMLPMLLIFIIDNDLLHYYWLLKITGDFIISKSHKTKLAFKQSSSHSSKCAVTNTSMNFDITLFKVVLLFSIWGKQWALGSTLGIQSLCHGISNHTLHNYVRELEEREQLEFDYLARVSLVWLVWFLQ